MDLSYYDEEITVGDLSNIHSLSSRNETLGGISSGNRFAKSSLKEHNKQASGNLSSDDDGLLQDIADDDNDEDDDDDIDVNDKKEENGIDYDNFAKSGFNLEFPIKNLNSKNSSSTNAKSFLSTTRTTLGNYMDSASKEQFPALKGDTLVDGNDSISLQIQRSGISVDKWEKLFVHQDIKDLFPYILKYIPQAIEIKYHLQPFIPDYIPAVGDVDAFLKVTQPKMIPNIGDSNKVCQHFQHLGLTVVDEPSEDQSEPSLLAMKLRSTLSGGGVVNSRASSAFMGPVVKTSRDIDKWIQEIENVHSSQLFLDIQTHKDIDEFLLNWPSIDTDIIKEAYQRTLSGQSDLIEYLQIVFQQFGIMSESLKTHADYLINIRTLVSLYLIINQI